MGDYREQGMESSNSVYSDVVRAGKRTYFFDIKETRGHDQYMVMTESRRKQERDGSFTYEKQKIFLYKEDFNKFEEGLLKAIDFVKKQNPEFFENESRYNKNEGEKIYSSTTSDIDKEFDEL